MTKNSASPSGNQPLLAPPAFKLHEGNPLLPLPVSPLPLPEPPLDRAIRFVALLDAGSADATSGAL